MIIHVPGKDNERADALSRRDQDLPKDAQDDRLMDRHIQLLRPEVLTAHTKVYAMLAETRETRAVIDGNAGDVIRTAIDTLREPTDSLIMTRTVIDSNAGDVIRTAIDTLREPTDSLIMVRELTDEIAEWDTIVEQDNEY